MYHVRGGSVSSIMAYDQKRKIYRKGVQRKGIPDIIGIIISLFWDRSEDGKDRQSADQKGSNGKY